MRLREQIDELEAFARPLGVESFPSSRCWAIKRRYRCSTTCARSPNIPARTRSQRPTNAFGFLSNCFQEIADAFDSKYFHAGLDESGPGLRQERRVGQTPGPGPVHAAHYRRINELLKRRGKTMIMYGDIILKYLRVLDPIPKDIVLMDWQYEPADHYPTVDVLGSKGFPIIVLPGMSNWDRIFPDMSKAMDQHPQFHAGLLPSALSARLDHVDLERHGSKNLGESLYYGYAYGAEVPVPESTDVSSYSDRFFTLQNGPGTVPYFEAIYALLEKWPWWFPLLRLFPASFFAPQGRAAAYDPGAVPCLRRCPYGPNRATCSSRWSCAGKGEVDYLRYCAMCALCRKPAAGRGSERVCERRFVERSAKRGPGPVPGTHRRGTRRSGQPSRHVREPVAAYEPAGEFALRH